MWLRKAAGSLEHILSPVMSSVGFIGSSVTALAMLLIVADVFGRRFFNQPITGTLEINEFMLVIITFCTIAFCQFIKGHITIDILVERLSQKTQNLIDTIIYVFYLIISALLSWQLYVQAFTILKQQTTSGTLQIPVYPFAFIAAIGCTLLCLVVLMHLFMYLTKVIEK
jgi:TRAP-type C4-dicarboxylate transport system permease small subunit